MSKKIRLDKVCVFNLGTISSKNTLDIIQYLDTSNITRNRIDTLQLLEMENDTFPSRAKRRVKHQTIIYSSVRPEQEHFGILENPPENLIVSTGFITLDVFDENIYPKYLYYNLTQKHITQYLHTVATNNVSAYPSINSSDLECLELDFPDLDTQQKIAHVLSVLDAKIDLNNRINAELEAMAKTLYDYWFVQFDFPNEENKPYKTSGGKMVWNEELKREIPEGWEVNLISDWVEKDKSGDWGKDEQEGNYTEKVSCIRGADINGLNGLGALNPPTRFILEKNSHKILNAGDLIIEISGGSPTQSTARLAYITDATIKRFENPLICSNFCKAITLKDQKMLYNFVYQWNNLYEAGIFFGYEGKTSGIKNFLFESFVNSYSTVFPPIEIMNKFYDFADKIQTKRQTALLENQQLAALRDWLLPMLMNGQVVVD